MDTNKELKDILLEIQGQNKDLLNLYSNLVDDFNKQAMKLNHDFYEVYYEIYNKKTKQEALDFLKSKQFIANESNEQIFNMAKEGIMTIEKRFENIDKHLEKIKDSF